MMKNPRPVRTRVRSTRRRRLPAQVVVDREALLAEAKTSGRAAASSPFPDEDCGETQPPGALRLKERARGDLEQIERYRHDDIPFFEAVCARCERRIDRLQQRWNRWAERHLLLGMARAEVETELGEDEFDKHRQHEGWMNRAGLALTVAMILIVACDAALNFVVLQLLGASRPVTWLGTVAVGLAQVLGAHLLGGARADDQRRQRQAEKEASGGLPHARETVWLLAAALIGTLAFFAPLRAYVLENDQRLLAQVNPALAQVPLWAAMLFFAFVQFLFNVVSFTVGCHRRSVVVEGAKMLRSRQWWVRRRLERIEAELSRACARSIKAHRRLVGRLREFAAWGRQTVGIYQEAIEAYVEAFCLSAGADRAAALAAQERPTVDEPSWITACEEKATELAKEVPTFARAEAWAPPAPEQPGPDGPDNGPDDGGGGPGGGSERPAAAADTPGDDAAGGPDEVSVNPSCEAPAPPESVLVSGGPDLNGSDQGAR
jgi:hypothetical protein